MNGAQGLAANTTTLLPSRSSTAVMSESSIDQNAQIGAAHDAGKRLGRSLFLTYAPEQSELNLPDVDLAGINQLQCVARASPILDVDRQPLFLEPALFLCQMHSGVEAPRREIQPAR
jgi:hypothetical protein